MRGHSPSSIRVRTGSRLHFGLFQFGAETPWIGCDGTSVLPNRRFGGIGLMVEEPALQLHLVPATQWQVQGPHAERALAFARTFLDTLPQSYFSPAWQLRIEKAPGQHLGLGTGTQLALAVGTALARALGLDCEVREIARRLRRGQRSGLGVHGFTQGGFLVEAGKTSPDEVAPLVAGAPFPEEWRILLIVPEKRAGLHGPQEMEAFRRLAKPSVSGLTETLCRLVLLGLLPALQEEDFPGFSEALYDFNHRVGLAFAAEQGGPYSSPRLAEVVAFLRGGGVRGVAQSSWGPSLAAVMQDEEVARFWKGNLEKRFGLGEAELLITQAKTCGATIEIGEGNG